MAYEPTVWKTGDVITAALLNKAEQGIADAGTLIAHSDGDVLDIQAKPLYDAIAAGKRVICLYADDPADVSSLPISECGYTEADGYVFAIGDDAYIAASDTDYPERSTD